MVLYTNGSSRMQVMEDLFGEDQDAEQDIDDEENGATKLIALQLGNSSCSITATNESTPRYKITKHKEDKKWSEQENECLREIMRKEGQNTWPEIAEELSKICGTELKKPSSVSQHWQRTLNISKKEWSDEEDLIVKKYYQIYNNKWALISQHLQGRSDLQIKYRISVLKNANFL